jgi:hypothetical protein
MARQSMSIQTLQPRISLESQSYHSLRYMLVFITVLSLAAEK